MVARASLYGFPSPRIIQYILVLEVRTQAVMRCVVNRVSNGIREQVTDWELNSAEACGFQTSHA